MTGFQGRIRLHLWKRAAPLENIDMSKDIYDLCKIIKCETVIPTAVSQQWRIRCQMYDLMDIIETIWPSFDVRVERSKLKILEKLTHISR